MNCNQIITLINKNNFTYEEVSQLHETLTAPDKKTFLEQIILEQTAANAFQEFNSKIEALQKYNITKLTNSPATEIHLLDLNHMAKLIDIQKIVETLLTQNSYTMSLWTYWIPNWFAN